ncbi:hypothetical protein [Pseudomonas sp. CDFA 610]|uniref:hypothetical protein n=1 Tax=Pseudomonas sp. CDFA 610 TaxID=2829825 RepID=UPI001E405327|nr:hypothetical protein [Pseudomonas sp. CDFA 610]MCD5983843.1 hypothetical protein [Pseudomonas sp. CDFA 610]
MNALTKNLVCLALAGLAGCAPQGVNTPMNDAIRTIYLAEKSDGGGSSCSFEVKNENVFLNREDHGCENDEMRYFKLDNVRSAMVVVFESRDCDEEGGWVFKIKTYIDPLTTPWLDIDDLETAAEGSIYSRGVRVESIRADGPDKEGKLSCVRVIPSELPPTGAGMTGSDQRSRVN